MVSRMSERRLVERLGESVRIRIRRRTVRSYPSLAETRRSAFGQARPTQEEGLSVRSGWKRTFGQSPVGRHREALDDIEQFFVASSVPLKIATQISDKVFVEVRPNPVDPDSTHIGDERHAFRTTSVDKFLSAFVCKRHGLSPKWLETLGQGGELLRLNRKRATSSSGEWLAQMVGAFTFAIHLNVDRGLARHSQLNSIYER